MAGLSRRRFLATVGAVAAAWRLAPVSVGRALAVDPVPDVGVTTLDRTIRMGPAGPVRYRTLVPAPGEPYVERLDVLRRAPDAARADRAPLARLPRPPLRHARPWTPSRRRASSRWQGDHSALGRCHAAAGHAHRARGGAVVRRWRPGAVAGDRGAHGGRLGHGRLRRHALRASSSLGTSDARRWRDPCQQRCARRLRGRPGVAARRVRVPPGGPRADQFGAYGFPAVPGLLDRAVSNPVLSAGLPVPWFTVFGNHDTTFMGPSESTPTCGRSPRRRKAVGWEALAADYLGVSHPTPRSRCSGSRPSRGTWDGSRTYASVTPDPAASFRAGGVHGGAPPLPGRARSRRPRFTQADLDTGRTWWTPMSGRTSGLFGLDTCNQIAGADGAVPEDQFKWLKAGSAAPPRRAACDHLQPPQQPHPRERRAPRSGQTELLHAAEEFIDLLLSYPAVVGWVNGHTHMNTIPAHGTRVERLLGDHDRIVRRLPPAAAAHRGRRQPRRHPLALHDRRSTTRSREPGRRGDDSRGGLASLSRELARNDWVEIPRDAARLALDRNSELLLPAPFDLSTITRRAMLEEVHRRPATPPGC